MSLVTDEIKSKLNIVDLIGEYVRLQKAGASWKACCPFHNEKTPSFSVSEDKQVWHCFGCGKGGDLFAFLMEIEGLEFREALENLAQRTGVIIPEYTKGNEVAKENRNKIWEILDLVTKFYKKQLWEGEGKENALKYLRDRGLNDKTINDFNLGYAPKGWRNILDFLKSKNYSVEDILKTGVLVEKSESANNLQNSNSNCYDRFRERIIFPIMDISGKTVGYSARVAPGGDESQAKYVNTPETEVYHKSSTLYGIDKAKMEIKKEDWVLLVEGNMDVIAAWQAGIVNTVAISGTALTSEQLNIIKRYTHNIKMSFDMDEAGQKAAKRSAELAFEKEISVSIVEIENGKDAADAVRENANKFLKAIKKSSLAMEYFIQKALNKYNQKNIDEKKKIIQELNGLITSLANKVEKEYWIKNIAEKLDISEKILFDTFNKVEYTQRKFDDKIKEINEKPIIQDRKNNIQIQIMGLLVSDNDVWKDSIKKYKKEIEKYFSNQKILDILSKGEKINFNFENLLNEIDDEKQKTYLRKLYFENIEKMEDFSSVEEKLEAVSEYFVELEKEFIKTNSEDIVKKIKVAEEADDKAKIKQLTKKLADLSK